jgi:hypothetical protein
MWVCCWKIVAVFVVCGLSVCSPLWAWNRHSPNTPLIVQNAQFSLSRKGISLHDFLGEMARQEGKTYTTDDDSQSLLLHVHLRERSFEEVRTAIATLLPGEWETTEKGYHLRYSEVARKQRREWWKLYLAEYQQWISTRQQILLKEMRRPLLTERQLAEIKDVNLRQGVENAQQPLRFWSALSVPQQNAIAAIPEDRFLLSRTVLSTMTSREGGVFLPASALTPTATNALIAVAKANGYLANPDIPKSAGFLPEQVAGYVFYGQGLSLYADAVRTDGSRTLSGISLSYPDFSIALSAYLDHAALLEFTKQPFKTLPRSEMQTLIQELSNSKTSASRRSEIQQILGQQLILNGQLTSLETMRNSDVIRLPNSWRILATFQERPVWQEEGNKLQKQIPSIVTPRISDKLHQIAKQYQVDFISDYYAQACFPYSNSRYEKDELPPLSTEMDKVATRHDVSWKQVDKTNLLLIRNNRWYRDDL